MTAPAKHSEARAARDEGARRILNLLFVLNSSAEPISTEQIIADSDIGYGSDNPQSDKRKFRRDREKLAEQGIVIRAVHPDGTPESEQSAWEIDRVRTHVTPGIISRDDADTLLHAIDDQLTRTDIAYRSPLASIRAKIQAVADLGKDGRRTGTGKGAGRDSGASSSAQPRPRTASDGALEAVWTAFALHRRLTILYSDAAGATSKRTIAIYGLFSQQGHPYFVGHDTDADAIRTFRVDRVQRAWRPTTPYRVPRDFSITDYLFFTFELSGATAVTATFSFPAASVASELTSLTHGRGTLAAEADGTWLWSIPVKNMREAAAFCLAHASMGMRPVAPGALVTSWNQQIDQVVNAHEPHNPNADPDQR